MKKIYLVNIKSPEAQGMFDDTGNIIDHWYMNDANWRGDYFNEMMFKLGIEVLKPDEKMFKKLSTKLKKNY